MRKIFILVLIFAWIFSGWPPIWNNPPIPPKIQEAYAADLESEDFEVGWGNWTDDASGCVWVRNQGSTPSSSTGPNHDNTVGDATGWYLFVETSSSVCGTTDIANLTGPNLDGTTYSIDLSFYYHMYGAAMGTLYVDVYDGTWNNGVWSISGQQHTAEADAYTQAIVDLDAYTGTIQIRFRYDQSPETSYTGDAAIDDILISGTLRNAAPNTPTLAETPAFTNMDSKTATPVLGNFSATDDDGDALEYDIQWTTDYTFTTGVTTQNSANYATNGFTAATFASGANVSYTVQAGEALTNGQTFWWRVRARDPSGSNTWTSYSAKRSITIDTSLSVDQWLQTTTEQFDSANGNTLTDTQATAGGVKLIGW